MIPGCTVVELRADRTPGEQAQGAYGRALAELFAADPFHYASAFSHKVQRATQFAWRVARDARRNAAEHTRQGLVTEHFVDQSVPRYGAWSGLDADNPPY